MYTSLAHRIIREAHQLDPELHDIELDLRNEITTHCGPDADDVLVPLEEYINRLASLAYQLGVQSQNYDSIILTL
jgi:hypothetical protein